MSSTKYISSQSVSQSSPKLTSPDRFLLQRAAGELLPADRCAWCHKRLRPDASTVKVFHSAERARAHYAGLMACERVWLCAVCASRISEHRRKELSAAIAAHPEFVPVLATFTVPHHAGQRLADVYANLAACWNRFLGGRAWVALQAAHDVAGWVVNLDVTHGDNGWHPHHHVLFFLRWGDDLWGMPEREQVHYKAARLAALELDFWLRWRDLAAWRGLEASHKAFDVRIGNDAVADYLAKYGRMPVALRQGAKVCWSVSDELTKAVAKRARGDGRSPWQLLGDAAFGDDKARALWLEYAALTEGKQLLRYSHGLRALLGLGDELTAAELIQADSDAATVTLLAELTLPQWKCVLLNDARGALLAAAASGDRAALWSWLRALPGFPDGDTAPVLISGDAAIAALTWQPGL